MSSADDTDALLDRIANGDGSAVERLMERHRKRLQRMVAFRLDPRLAPRFDASDVVQEAMIKGTREINSYLECRGDIPFYAWLHRLAWQQLVALYRRHVISQRRSVRRELPPLLPDGMSILEFRRVEMSRYPCLALATQAGRTGGSAVAVMNAANEVAVSLFLDGKIGFTGIPSMIESVLERHDNRTDPSLDDILRADAWAREEAHRLIHHSGTGDAS